MFGKYTSVDIHDIVAFADSTILSHTRSTNDDELAVKSNGEYDLSKQYIHH